MKNRLLPLLLIIGVHQAANAEKVPAAQVLDSFQQNQIQNMQLSQKKGQKQLINNICSESKKHSEWQKIQLDINLLRTKQALNGNNTARDADIERLQNQQRSILGGKSTGC